ncbi:hypothetical protein FGB62_86g00 [Gracilaria domingensis]|nr:hypothetical protein FGB62_86g00 [Gracilaria domingensis]
MCLPRTAAPAHVVDTFARHLFYLCTKVPALSSSLLISASSAVRHQMTIVDVSRTPACTATHIPGYRSMTSLSPAAVDNRRPAAGQPSCVLTRWTPENRTELHDASSKPRTSRAKPRTSRSQAAQSRAQAAQSRAQSRTNPHKPARSHTLPGKPLIGPWLAICRQTRATESFCCVRQPGSLPIILRFSFNDHPSLSELPPWQLNGLANAEDGSYLNHYRSFFGLPLVCSRFAHYQTGISDPFVQSYLFLF